MRSQGEPRSGKAFSRLSAAIALACIAGLLVVLSTLFGQRDSSSDGSSSERLTQPDPAATDAAGSDSTRTARQVQSEVSAEVSASDRDSKERVPASEQAEATAADAAIDPRQRPALEAMMQNEPRDEAWAPYAETKLQDYLAREDLEGDFRSAVVECRSSVCRIAVVVEAQATPATDQGNMTQPSLDKWYATWSKLDKESTWPRFAESADKVAVDYRYPDRLFLTHFVRHSDEPRQP